MRYDDPKVQTSAVLGLVGAVALFVIIVLLQALFYSMEEEELSRKVYSQPHEALQTLDADQIEQLTSYRWISQPDGVARIPIDRAMELVVAEGVGEAEAQSE